MILVVDDEPLARLAIGRILGRQGYEVMEAADGWEALDFLSNWRFDLVLTDVRMPNLDGADLAAQIHINWPETPVILMSGYITEKVRKLISEGSTQFLQKPIDRNVLIANIQRLASSPAQKTPRF